MKGMLIRLCNGVYIRKFVRMGVSVSRQLYIISIISYGSSYTLLNKQ